MVYNKWQRSRFLIITCFVTLFWLPDFVGADSPSLVVKVHEGLIDIYSDKVPIGTILQEISLQSGIVFTPEIEFSQEILVSIQKQDEPLERFIHRILRNHNCILVFNTNQHGQLVPSEVQMFSNASLKQSSDHLPVPSFENKFHIKKQLYEDWVMDTDNLLSMLTIATKKPAQEEQGIQISGVEENSYFKKIGLEPGDYVKDVNGQSTKTKNEFIRALQAGLAMNPPIIRIERLKENLVIDPIYIELNSIELSRQ